MKQNTRVLMELLEETRETNRLIKKMNRSISLLMKRITPEIHSVETISKGESITEITVRSPEKFEEWKNLFASKGLRVEYYEPLRTDGNGYFAKLWGYLEKDIPHPQRKSSQ